MKIYLVLQLKLQIEKGSSSPTSRQSITKVKLLVENNLDSPIIRIKQRFQDNPSFCGSQMKQKIMSSMILSGCCREHWNGN